MWNLVMVICVSVCVCLCVRMNVCVCGGYMCVCVCVCVKGRKGGRGNNRENIHHCHKTVIVHVLVFLCEASWKEKNHNKQIDSLQMRDGKNDQGREKKKCAITQKCLSIYANNAFFFF